jgi:hypothetical protein
MRSRLPARVLAALSIALLLLLAAACGDGGGSDDEAVPTGPTATSGPPPTSPNVDLDLCAGVQQVLGNVAPAELTEISGLAAGRASEDVLWAHNDSGDTARVFALARDGSLVATYNLTGAEAVDWEDMAIGPGPEDGVDYLYLADIGDNAATRPEVVLYRVPEPEVDAAAGVGPIDVNGVERLAFTYPDHPHDAETLLIDPVLEELFILTKDLQTNVASIFSASTAVEPGQSVVLSMAGQLDLTRLQSKVVLPPEAPQLPRAIPALPTGGDVAPDGDVIALRTYSTVWLWRRLDNSSSLIEAFRNAPCEGPSQIEVQGEAIALDPDAGGYITVSEGANPLINHFGAP